MSRMSGMAGMGRCDICGDVNGGERCGSLTKTREPAEPAPTFVKASGAGGVRRWT